MRYDLRLAPRPEAADGGPPVGPGPNARGLWADLGGLAFTRFGEFDGPAKILQALGVITQPLVNAGVHGVRLPGSVGTSLARRRAGQDLDSFIDGSNSPDMKPSLADRVDH